MTRPTRASLVRDLLAAIEAVIQEGVRERLREAQRRLAGLSTESVKR